MLPCQLDGLIAPSRLTDDVEALLFEYFAQVEADDRLVLGDHDGSGQRVHSFVELIPLGCVTAFTLRAWRAARPAHVPTRPTRALALSRPRIIASACRWASCQSRSANGVSETSARMRASSAVSRKRSSCSSATASSCRARTKRACTSKRRRSTSSRFTSGSLRPGPGGVRHYLPPRGCASSRRPAPVTPSTKDGHGGNSQHTHQQGHDVDELKGVGLGSDSGDATSGLDRLCDLAAPV